VNNGGYRRVDQTDHPYPGAAARRVRGVIERLLHEGAAVARSDGTTHDLFPIAVSAAEGEALRGWVGREGATRTVEIGLAYAVSALHVCEGLLENGDPEARHVAIDPIQETYFSSCGLQFVDGNHHFDGVFVDLCYLGRHVRPGGVVFLDDYQLPAVKRAASFFLRNLGWELEEVSEWDELHRWAVLRTSTAPDARPFGYYVDF
jgi:methyltransferase family protein